MARPPLVRLTVVATLGIALLTSNPSPAAEPTTSPRADRANIEDLRPAINDLIDSFGERYGHGHEYLARLDALQGALRSGDSAAGGKLDALRRQALLANPLLDFERLILLKRKRGQLGLPTNHQCNTSLGQSGYDNEIAILSPVDPRGKLQTLFRPPEGFYVGEFDLNFDADRLLFTMPDGRTWNVCELNLDDADRRPRRLSPGDHHDVDNFDACYLPDGRIVFASTACFTGVPCWHGRERACSLYVMNADGSGTRQLCFDQDLDLHPAVLPNGQVIYSRWDYTGLMHVYPRLLMAMNPDGTSQRAIYGTNSYYPNALYFPRGVPGSPNKLVAVLSGYHGVHRMGEMVLIDTTAGWREADGIVQRIAHRGEPPEVVVRDALVDKLWPKFLHPYPLSEKYFLAAAQLSAGAPWGIYLVDTFDNMLPLCLDGRFDFFEPIPVKKSPHPPLIPDRTDPSRDDAVVYLHNVYAGPGLAGVPHGAVKRLRIVGYHFGYPGMAGPDKIGRGGPWDAMRILGTVPVHEDGSAKFRVPAGTPISIQPLDAQGRALQLMRSWYTAMPGETASCVGCHEQPLATPIVRSDMAAREPAVEIEPWYGPPRGFDFQREVQPVLDEYCVACHDGRVVDSSGLALLDLRSEELVENYQGLPLTKLGADRLEPETRALLPSCAESGKSCGNMRMLYTPAYDALSPFIRRVNVEDYVGLLNPGEYYADTSELVRLLQRGHHGVRLDGEAWDRIVTWIDMNGPCHGTWGDVAPIPYGAGQRRRELALAHGGPTDDPEFVPPISHAAVEPITPAPEVATKQERPDVSGWPFDAREARRRQAAAGPTEKALDLGNGVTLRLTRIPAGSFVMGSDGRETDERPASVARVDRDFWMATTEVTNQQFARFHSSHDSGLFMKRSLDVNGPGVSMREPGQPVVRVSWLEAVEFCDWLSRRSGLQVTLPTESQWEYAARAGSSGSFQYEATSEDFSTFANLADASLGPIRASTGGVFVLQDFPRDDRFDDGALTTTAVGGYHPNAWGLYDMHGNAAEWTASDDEDRKVVRGGSYHDRPKHARFSSRSSYPAWRRVHDVGFRVVCEASDAD